METDRKWIVVRIDGKIAAISTDYRQLAAISSQLAQMHHTTDSKARNRKGKRSAGRKSPDRNCIYGNITAEAVSFEEVWRLRQETRWEDLMLFGTEFQKKVWRMLWELTHPETSPVNRNWNVRPTVTATAEIPENGSYGEDTANSIKARPQISSGHLNPEKEVRLISYTDFAELCQNKAGVRAVAHAIGLNPVAVVVPCHLVVPKESVDRILDIHRKAETTIFKGEDLSKSNILMDNAIDFGEYSLGRKMKRRLIIMELE